MSISKPSKPTARKSLKTGYEYSKKTVTSIGLQHIVGKPASSFELAIIGGDPMLTKEGKEIPELLKIT